MLQVTPDQWNINVASLCTKNHHWYQNLREHKIFVAYIKKKIVASILQWFSINKYNLLQKMLISFDNNMDVNLENQKNRIFSSEFKLSWLLTHWPSSFSVSNDPILNQFWLQTSFVQNRVAQLLETFVTLQSSKESGARVKYEFESWD